MTVAVLFVLIVLLVYLVNDWVQSTPVDPHWVDDDTDPRD